MRRIPSSVGSLAALLCILAGCLATQPAAPNPELGTPRLGPLFDAPIPALECGNCHEPSVAVDFEGRIYVTTAGAHIFVRSDDGGTTWTQLPLPASAGPFEGNPSDNLFQVAPNGRLYFSTFLTGGSFGLGPAGSFAYRALGIDLAWSDDGGETWTRSWFSLPTSGDLPTTAADRQWLAFGTDERVYLTWKHQPVLLSGPVSFHDGLGLYAARSDDGGVTFPDVTQIAAQPLGGFLIGGTPLVLPDGTLLAPYFSHGPNLDDQGLFVARSTDGMATFSRVPLLAHQYAGGFFPVLATLSDGTTALAWFGPHQEFLLAFSSDDGVTWTQKAPWTSNGEKLAAAGPWIQAGPNGSLRALAPIQDNESTARLRFYDWAPGQDHPNSTDLSNVSGTFFRPANTEFAHFDLDAQGRAFVVGAKRDEGFVFLQRERLEPPRTA